MSENNSTEGILEKLTVVRVANNIFDSPFKRTKYVHYRFHKNRQSCGIINHLNPLYKQSLNFEHNANHFMSDILVKFWSDSLLLLCVLLAGPCQYFRSHSPLLPANRTQLSAPHHTDNLKTKHQLRQAAATCIILSSS